MTFAEFEERAATLWQEIPAEYREGVDGVRVERAARAHPSLDGVYTLGECLTESYPSEWGGPDTIRSFVVLYYGSFWRLSREDDSFDWAHELWETLTHELQHHLESLAAEDALGDLDHAADENFKRLQGEPFDPQFYRSAEPLGDGWWRIEEEYFREYRGRETSLEFEWEGARYVVAVPDATSDLLFLDVVEGVAGPPRGLTLVVERPLGLGATLHALLRGRPARIAHHEVTAERAP